MIDIKDQVNEISKVHKSSKRMMVSSNSKPFEFYVVLHGICVKDIVLFRVSKNFHQWDRPSQTIVFLAILSLNLDMLTIAWKQVNNILDFKNST